MRRVTSWILLAGFCWMPGLSSAATTLIHAGTLLAEPGQSPAQNQTIVIEGDRVVAVTDGFTNPASLTGEVQLIDLTDQFVLPGLIDMHVHLLLELGPNSRNEALYVSTPLQTLRGAMYARRTLEAGFTTVRDLGGQPEAIYALRDAIEQGYLPGPRVIAAGSALAATGGHGDVDGYRAELLDLWTPETICDGPYDCRRAARHAIKYGADWIKITATGGVLSDTATGTGVQMTDDELREIIDTAHGLGVKVAAHAHGADGINAALNAGIDSIDHGTFLDDVSIRLFKRYGAYLVPTLLPGHSVPKTMEGNPFFTAAIRAKANEAARVSKENFARAHRAGVKVAFGTDTGVTPHGRNADEFALMVAAGMTPMEAISTATLSAADLLDMEDSLGSIVPGKLADIIAVNGNPLEDIRELEDVGVVIKGGRVAYRRD